MTPQNHLGIIPAQTTGEEIDACCSVKLPDTATAISFYEQAKQKLLDVNNWHQVAGVLTARFQLMDASGSPVYRHVKLHDYFQIDIPGPGNSSGKGYDWVLVEAFEEVSDKDLQSIGFRVRPAPNPAGDDNDIAHFYSVESTSCFMVTREETTVTVSVIDRNISPNKDSDSLIDKVRNSPVAIGAINMFSKYQWQHLADGIAEKK